MSDQNAKELAEQRAMKKYAALKSATEDVVSVQKSYIDITGDIPSALVLDELIFWTLPRKGGRSGLRSFHDGVLWLAVGRDEWWDRKRLNPNQADYAIEKLQKLGVVEKRVFKYDGTPRVHIRLIATRFFELFSEAIQKSIAQDEPDEMLEIADLYAMMGLDDSLFRKIPKSISENSEVLMISENSEIINSPHPTNTMGAEAPARPEPKKKGDLLDGMLHFAALGADPNTALKARVAEYPADVQATIQALAEIYAWPAASIPARPARSSKGDKYAQWINEARQINQVIAGYGREALEATVLPCKRLSVSHPAAIMWCLPGEVGKLSKRMPTQQAEPEPEPTYTRPDPKLRANALAHLGATR